MFAEIDQVVKFALKFMVQMGQSIQDRLSKFCGRQPLKQLKGYGLVK